MQYYTYSTTYIFQCETSSMNSIHLLVNLDLSSNENAACYLQAISSPTAGGGGRVYSREAMVSRVICVNQAPAPSI